MWPRFLRGRFPGPFLAYSILVIARGGAGVPEAVFGVGEARPVRGGAWCNEGASSTREVDRSQVARAAFFPGGRGQSRQLAAG